MTRISWHFHWWFGHFFWHWKSKYAWWYASFYWKSPRRGKFNRYAQYYLSWRYMNDIQIIQYNINPRFLPILHMWFKLGNLFSEKFPWWIIILWRRPASFATAQSDQHLNCTCCTLYQISPIQASLIENWSRTVQNYCCISFFCAVPKKEHAAKHWRRAPCTFVRTTNASLKTIFFWQVTVFSWNVWPDSEAIE